MVLALEDARSKNRREGPVVFLVNEVLGDYAAAAMAYAVWTLSVLVIVPLVLPDLALGPLGFWGVLAALLLGFPLAGLAHVLAHRT